MKTVEEHLHDILATIEALHPLDLQLLDAHGCILAEDVRSTTDVPSFDNSAMDGYAVRIGDVVSATADTPVVLPVVGDVAAGSSGAYSIARGQCVRIMTGAPVPAGGEAIVPVEWTDAGVASVSISQAPEPGQHIRRHGEDVRAGDTVLKAGTRIGPAHVALLAAVGRARVVVRPRPRVVVISTGSELVEAGVVPGPGQITDSNGPALTAAVRDAGGVAYRVGIVPDDPRTVLDAIEDQLVRADLVITTGGVSAGAYDTVKEVLSRLGTVTFEPVAMQPGKPQGFGTVGPDSTPIFTLPGNPVSAFVSFEVFVRPVMRKMLGVEPLHRPMVRASTLAPISSAAGRQQYVRANLQVVDGRYVVEPMGRSGSHLVADLAAANAFVVVPPSVTTVPVGGTVQVMVLERRFG